MSRGEKRVLLVVMLVLALALTLMLVQTLTGGDAQRVYRVSVLTDGTDENYWRSFRKGLEQAALELNVDVRYVTRYDGSGSQGDALRQEWEGETDGVVVIPVDASALALVLEDAPQRLAVALSGARVDTGHPAVRVSADNQQMGARLADAVFEGGASACTVFLPSKPGSAVEERYAGISARLAELGLSCALVETDDPAGERFPRGRALVALEPATAEALCQDPAAAGRVYGVGSSNRLLRCLEDGQAAALVVQSDYAAGYLSLQRTVETLRGRPGEDVTLDSYTVTKENMFTEPLAQLLFPITG